MWKKTCLLVLYDKVLFRHHSFFIIRSRAKHTHTYILANKKRIPPKCIQRKRPNKDFLPATIHSNLHTEKDRQNIFWMKYIAESLALTDYYTTQRGLTLSKIRNSTSPKKAFGGAVLNIVKKWHSKTRNHVIHSVWFLRVRVYKGH